jgi:hypothetical protein
MRFLIAEDGKWKLLTREETKGQLCCWATLFNSGARPFDQCDRKEKTSKPLRAPVCRTICALDALLKAQIARPVRDREIQLRCARHRP